jgi:3-oxoacyl-[acyl-carrier-protein] synthase-3
MNFTFRKKRISGILTVVPANELSFVAEMKNFNFPEARSLKLMEVMGYKKRRLVQSGVCVSDLAVPACSFLIAASSATRLMPGRSSRRLGLLHAADQLPSGPDRLKQDTFCLISTRKRGFRHRVDGGVHAARKERFAKWSWSTLTFSVAKLR